MLPGWEGYVTVYVAVTLLYLWYRFTLLLLTELRQKKAKAPYGGELVSVIIPFYNEDPKLLEASVRSVLAARGRKEVIVVDDGSPSKACSEMVRKTFGSPVRLFSYPKNYGKRFAQRAGLAFVKGTYVVTIDSDTTIDKDALINIIEPLSDPKVGATTGNVMVLNKRQNLLTRLIAARYWNAFNIERKSLSGFGIVTCCSGVLSAYRKSLFARLMAAYDGQRFLGVRCTYGDDRHLTNLVLMHGYKIRYVGDAICHTHVPEKMGTFLRQQVRWKKSFLRESLITLSFAFRQGLLLPFEVLLNITIPFLGLPIRIMLILAMILNPVLIFFFIGSVITVACIRNFFLFFEDRKLAIFSIPYAFVHELMVFWLYFVALAQLRETKWGTR